MATITMTITSSNMVKPDERFLNDIPLMGGELKEGNLLEADGARRTCPE
jgi:hypothetical protein